MGVKWFKDLYTSIINNLHQALPPPQSTETQATHSQVTSLQLTEAQRSILTQSTETHEASDQYNPLQDTETQASSLQPIETQIAPTQENLLRQTDPHLNSIQTQPVSSQSTKSQQTLLSLAPDKWEVNRPYQLPHNAVPAGHDVDGKIMYVGRVFHNGDYIPAKVFNVLNLAMFPYNGFELHVLNFEYLVGDKYKWVNGRPFPKGAVIVNPQSTGEQVYVGRGKYLNSLTCGKFVRSRDCLYIPFGLQEVPITEQFDILVHEDRYDDESSMDTITDQ